MIWILLTGLLTAPTYPCGDDVSEEGHCNRSDQVLWCENGVAKTLDCKDGHVCAWNEAANMFDCVLAECGDVPATGSCLDALHVQWCEMGQVITLTCAEGTECGCPSDAEGCDCTKSIRFTNPEPEMPTEMDPADASDPDTGADAQPSTTKDAGIPPIEYRPTPPEATAATDTESGGCQYGGHAASSHQLNWFLLLGLLALWGLARRWRSPPEAAVH
jgi:MYXO-CTERM domain-containing protein